MKENQNLLKIFYADDDADDRFLFEHALKDLDIPIHITCFDGGIKLENDLIERNYDCDLIFLDLNMPGWSGLQTLFSLQPAIKNHKIKVIVFTTSADEALVLKTYEMHALLYVQKPADFNVLVQTLTKIIRNIDSLQFPVPFKDFQYPVYE